MAPPPAGSILLDPPLRGGEELQEDGADAVVLHGQDLRGVTLFFWGGRNLLVKDCPPLLWHAIVVVTTSAFVQTMYHYTDSVHLCILGIIKGT